MAEDKFAKLREAAGPAREPAPEAPIGEQVVAPDGMAALDFDFPNVTERIEVSGEQRARYGLREGEKLYEIESVRVRKGIIEARVPTGRLLRQSGTKPDGSPRFARVRARPKYRDQRFDPATGKYETIAPRKVLRPLRGHRLEKNEPQPEGCPAGYEVRVSNAPLRKGELEIAPEMEVEGALALRVEGTGEAARLAVDEDRKAALLAARKNAPTVS